MIPSLLVLCAVLVCVSGSAFVEVRQIWVDSTDMNDTLLTSSYPTIIEHSE